jgi:hypothetical protein
MDDHRAKEIPVTPLKDLLQPDFGPPAAMPDLRTILEMTDEEELDCDQTCELLDQYVEGLERHDNVGTLFPGVDRHLKRGCPDCNAELKALQAAIEAAGSIP